MSKILTVAAIGLGGRGWNYTSVMKTEKGKFKVVAGCDLIKEKRENFRKNFGLTDFDVFESEDEFFKERRADVLIVATQDGDHVRHAIKGLGLGYDILCEKPISNNLEDCFRLLEAQKKYGKKIMVCHVLRYAPAFRKAKEILDAGLIGELITIDDIEQVQYLHQAHSFVRGNWRKKEETSPMILQKCCHDLDLLQWYANSGCEEISSLGDLRFFIPKNRPEGSAERCMDCKYVHTCEYSAYEAYITKKFWGRFAVLNGLDDTDENVIECLKTGPYGRCVFCSDNDVVDNEIVMMRFNNKVTANLRMTAFTANGGRILHFYGSRGELELNEEEGALKLKRFGSEPEIIPISSLTDAQSGHGGGDTGTVNAFYDYVTGSSAGETVLEKSIESHLMAFAAEESRLRGGEMLKINHKK